MQRPPILDAAPAWMRRRRPVRLSGPAAAAAACGAVSLALGVLFLAAMLRGTGGGLTAPLDDSYIYFQYARNLAAGRFYAYGPGEPYSTGSTSFLYPWLLAPGFLLGLDGPRQVLWALAVATALLWASATLLYVLAARWLGRGPAVLAVALFVLSGWTLWGIFNLMETGLYVALILASLLAWDRGREDGRFLAFGVAGALLVLTRPEGVALAAVLAALALADRALAAGRAGLADRRLLALLLPAAVAAGYAGLNRALSGSFTTNGLAAKSILYAPGLDGWDVAGHMARSFTTFLTEPFSSAEYVPPLMLLLAVVGAAGSAYQDAARRRVGPGSAAAALFLVGLAATSHNINPWLHWYRYVAGYQPLFALLAVAGLVWTARALRAQPGPALWVGGAYLLLFSVPTVAAFADRYSGAVSDIRQQHGEAAAWLREHVPEEDTVAVNDAGALPYLSGRRIYDLVGLVTNGAAPAMRAGPGSVMERLERLPREERPAYFAIYDDWFQGQFAALPMFREEHRLHLESVTIAGGQDKVIYRVDRGAFGSGEIMAEEHGQGEGWRVVDAVDVADLEDEAAHGYRILDAAGPGVPAPTLIRQILAGSGALVLDGGREGTRGEAFTLRVAPDRPVRLVLRTDGAWSGTRDVYVDGRFAGRLEHDAPGGWIEPELTVPADLVRSGRLRVEVRLQRPSGVERFTSFHYWALQPG
ncbi:MAG TPA: hypothetical protein VIO14_11955 [Dehalococcoidia bacterium]